MELKVHENGSVAAEPEAYRTTPITYVTLLLLAVAWPLISLYFFDAQLELTEKVTSPVSEIYLPTILVQLTIFVLILLALKSEWAPVRTVGFTNFNRWTILTAVLYLILSNVVLLSMQLALSEAAPGSFSEIRALLPKETSEKGIWILLSPVVAVSEEVAFRGYLITRISKLVKGRVWIGVLLSTFAFACGHLYQGTGGFVLIFVYGLMFSGLYLYTGSLYPGIIAHFLQDVSVLIMPDM